MTTDVLSMTFTDQVVVNGAMSLTLSNATFVLDGTESLETTGTGTVNVDATSISTAGGGDSGVLSCTFTAKIQCDGDVLQANISMVHFIESSVTVSTNDGGGTFIRAAGNYRPPFDFVLPCGTPTVGAAEPDEDDEAE
jgi:hypothetical protein